MRKLLAIAALLIGGTADADYADQRFWTWFGEHAKEIGTITKGDEPIAEALVAELQKVDPGLTLELGTTMSPKELIISAAGIAGRFPTVKRLVAAAPKMPGWKVIAFRPRKNLDAIDVAGRTYKMSELRFLAAATPERKVDVAIFAPGGDDKSTRFAVYLLLDTLLGEYDVETRVAEVEVADVKRAPAEARPFKELVKVVDSLPR